MSVSSVLFVVRGAESYGVQRKLLSIVKELKAQGVALALYAIGDGEFVDRCRAIGGIDIRVEPKPPPRFVGSGLRKVASYLGLIASSSSMVRGLADFLRRNPFEAVVFCERGWVVPLAVATRRFPGRVFWLMPDAISGDYPLDLNRRIYAAAFRRSRLVPIANSRFTRDTLGRASKWAEVIDLGADPGEFNRKPPPAAPVVDGLPEDAVKLVIVARLVAHKGQMLLLQALLSRPEFSPIHLVLVGGPLDTPYADALRDTAGGTGRLHMIGPTADPAPYYTLADVVVNARTDAEPFGLAIVEAMMAARPVLAHALGGPAEIIVDGATGWHVSAPTVEAFAEGLTRMMADRPRWSEMGAEGERRALERYTASAMTRALVAIIDRHGAAPALR